MSTQEQTQQTNQEGKVTLRSITKWLSWFVLGMCLFVVLLVLFVGSNLGLKTLSYFANKTDGISITEVKGSIYSQIDVGSLNIDESLGVGIDAKNIGVDVSLRCLMDFSFCLQHVHVEQLSVFLPLSEEQRSEDSGNEYIRAPLPIAVEKISIDTFVFSQAVLAETQALQSAPSVFTNKLLAFNNLIISDLSFDQDLTINSVSLARLHLFDGSDLANSQASASLVQAQQQNSQQAKDPKPSQNSQFRLAQLRDLLKTAPSIKLPEVFVPINARLDALAIDEICWLVADVPEAKNCLSLSSAQIKLYKQTLQSSINLSADAVLTNVGIEAQNIALVADLDFSKNWTHNVSLELIQTLSANSVFKHTLSLGLKGNISSTQLRFFTVDQSGENELLNLEAATDLVNDLLPIELAGTFKGTNKLAPFLVAESVIPEVSGVFKIAGDWNAYELASQLYILNEALNTRGLSEIGLSAMFSPANQIIALRRLESSGEIGNGLVYGKAELLDAQQYNNDLVVNSNLKMDIEGVNFGIFNTEPTQNWSTDLNGAFSIDHVFHDEWMLGDIHCEQLSGRVADYDVGLLCDVNISKDGDINIRKVALTQGKNTINIEGVIGLPSSDYLDLTSQELLQGIANLSLTADIQEASTLYADLGGRLGLDATIKGAISQPVILLSSTATGISYNGISLEQGRFNASMDVSDNYALSIDSAATELVVNDILISDSVLNLSGDKSLHELGISAQVEDYFFDQSLEGGFTSKGDFTMWQGLLTSLDIKLPFDHISLAEPVELLLNTSSKSVDAADHCYLTKKEDERLCVSELSVENGAGGANAFFNYDLARAGKYFLPELVLPATSLPLRSNINVRFTESEGLRATAFNNLIDGVLELETQLVELSAIVANLTLNEETLGSAIFAGTPSAGTLGIVSSITLNPENRQHEGQVSINDLDLNILKRFIPSIEDIAGLVNAQIGFAGALETPQLNGTLSVNSGEVIVDAYSYPLTAFNHNMSFEGQGATMQGAFNLGKGSAEYDAKLTLFDEFFIEGTLLGNNMQFALDSTKATISPDLAFSISPKDLVVSGAIVIPSAEIKVKEIPESALTPSSDVLIVGQEPEPPVLPMGIDIDLDIQIDNAKRMFVTVDALDLKASLSGNLDLQVEQKRRADGEGFQEMQTSLNGQVDILDGSYEAYAQNLLIRSGKILFNGVPSLPQFDITAIRNPLNTEGDVIAGIRVSGNPVVPRVELFSEPPLVQASQLSYLLQGKDLNSDGESTSQETMLLNLLVGYGVSSSGNSVGRLGNALGFDSLNIQTAGTGDSSQVQITGRIAQDIQITYGISVADQAPEIILKYQLMPKLFIEAKSGIDNTVDLFYQVTRGSNK